MNSVARKNDGTTKTCGQFTKGVKSYINNSHEMLAGKMNDTHFLEL